MKRIDILVKKSEIEKIVSGEVKEIYRKTSRYNMMLLTEVQPDSPPTARYKPRTDIDQVRFVDKYNNPSFVICEIVGIFADKFEKFVPKGIKPGTVALTIEIRRVLEHNL